VATSYAQSVDAYAGIQLRERSTRAAISAVLPLPSDACRVRYLRAGVVGLDIACEVVAVHDGRRSPAEQPTAHGADAHRGFIAQRRFQRRR